MSGSVTRGSRDVYLTAGTGGSFGASSLQQEIDLVEAPRYRLGGASVD